ncbi:MAG: KEOPS complex subunit Pcc1 [Candidatus Heimdallarchaeaceae archaeon]|uniref:Transcription factor Pcc1 n=1 Tax=Candidatus Heimdallarchaeum endolithica TaxID=2876572 RepID=A0A9Y1BP21_9ARCH|nr:MAG: hypothetical protein K9W46_07850 [Candidatus Heimdallarchaeum endolithica]
MIDGIEFTSRISFEDENTCKIIADSLEIETKNLVNDRAVVTINVDKKDLFLLIKAKDSVSARAAMNSYLKLIDVSLKVLQKTTEE